LEIFNLHPGADDATIRSHYSGAIITKIHWDQMDMTFADLEFANRADFVKAVELGTGEIPYQKPAPIAGSEPRAKKAENPRPRRTNPTTAQRKESGDVKHPATQAEHSSGFAKQPLKSYQDRPQISSFSSPSQPSNGFVGLSVSSGFGGVPRGGVLQQSKPVETTPSLIRPSGLPAQQTQVQKEAEKPTAKTLASSLQVDDGWGAKQLINSKKPGAGSLLQTIQ
jgi:hypothetical protein